MEVFKVSRLITEVKQRQARLYSDESRYQKILKEIDILIDILWLGLRFSSI